MESFSSVSNASFLQLFRQEGLPTHYSYGASFPNIDLTTTKILTLFTALWLIFLIISPGYPSTERWFFICRVTIFLTVPLAITVCFFTPYWETDSVEALIKTQFQSSNEMIAKIGLNIGLLGFNVTLEETPFLSVNQPVVYNEQFTWNWASSDSESKILEETGYLKHQYRQAASKGLPIPILWILDYFTIDGEDYRFARYYQHAGWYCHSFLWLSLGCWLLSNFLFCIVIEYGSLMMILTGLSLITTNIIWAFHSNPIPLEIPFRSRNGVNFLNPDYSWAYWINLANGLFCITLGTLVYILDLKYPDLTTQFFGIDIVQNYEQFFREIDEEKKRLRDSLDENVASGSKGRADPDAKYVALRKKVSSNRLSKIHRLTLRDPFSGRPFTKTTPSQIVEQESEPYYVVPKTVTIPVQPRVIGSIAARKGGPPEQFAVSSQ